jgi:hypothetical protein
MEIGKRLVWRKAFTSAEQMGLLLSAWISGTAEVVVAVVVVVEGDPVVTTGSSSDPEPDPDPESPKTTASKKI